MIPSRLYAALLFALVIQPATEALAQSGPRLPVWLAGPPLPEGAVRRFGKQPAPLPASTKTESTARRVSPRLEEPEPQPTRTVMALTHDGKQLVVADYTGRIDLWDV